MNKTNLSINTEHFMKFNFTPPKGRKSYFICIYCGVSTYSKTKAEAIEEAKKFPCKGSISKIPDTTTECKYKGDCHCHLVSASHCKKNEKGHCEHCTTTQGDDQNNGITDNAIPKKDDSMEEKIRKIVADCINHGYYDGVVGLKEPNKACQLESEQSIAKLLALFTQSKDFIVVKTHEEAMNLLKNYRGKDLLGKQVIVAPNGIEELSVEELEKALEQRKRLTTLIKH